jgi:hypothetical protein
VAVPRTSNFWDARNADTRIGSLCAWDKDVRGALSFTNDKAECELQRDA